MKNKLTILQGELKDLEEIQALFADTIQNICNKDYTPDQISAWTSSIQNKERWESKINGQYFVIARIDEKLVGFASLYEGNYLDLLYVDKDYQGHGIASLLYDKIVNKARQLHKDELYADVSITAKGFFQKAGFETIKKQVVTRKGIELTNYRMKKILH